MEEANFFKLIKSDNKIYDNKVELVEEMFLILKLSTYHSDYLSSQLQNKINVVQNDSRNLFHRIWQRTFNVANFNLETKKMMICAKKRMNLVREAKIPRGKIASPLLQLPQFLISLKTENHSI